MRKAIDAGKMNRTITIQKNTAGQTASGAKAPPNWVNVATNPTVPAFMDVLDSREKARTGQPVSEDLRVFQTWWREDVVKQMAVLCDGIRYEVTGIEPVELNFQIALLVKAVA